MFAEGQQYGESAAQANENDHQCQKTSTCNKYPVECMSLNKKHSAHRHKKFEEEAEDVEDKAVADRVHYKVGGSGDGEGDNEAKNLEQRRARLIEENRAAEKEEKEKQRNMGLYFEED